jgi:hypothetical protein
MAPHTNGFIFQTGQPKQEREEVHNAQRQGPYQVPKVPGTGVAAPNFRKAYAATRGCPVATRQAWDEIWHARSALKVARRQSCDFQLHPITAYWRENMEANLLLQSFSRNENPDQNIWLRFGNACCKHSSLLVITWLPLVPGMSPRINLVRARSAAEAGHSGAASRSKALNVKVCRSVARLRRVHIRHDDRLLQGTSVLSHQTPSPKRPNLQGFARSWKAGHFAATRSPPPQRPHLLVNPAFAAPDMKIRLPTTVRGLGAAPGCVWR